MHESRQASFGANTEFGDGGWHYTCQETNGDNSVSQWAAIGIIPARRNFGTDPLNAIVLTTDQNWLFESFTQASTNNGYFGYTSASPLWGPYRGYTVRHGATGDERHGPRNDCQRF